MSTPKKSASKNSNTTTKMEFKQANGKDYQMNLEDREYVIKTTPNNFKNQLKKFNNFDVRLLKSTTSMNHTKRNKAM